MDRRRPSSANRPATAGRFGMMGFCGGAPLGRCSDRLSTSPVKSKSTYHPVDYGPYVKGGHAQQKLRGNIVTTEPPLKSRNQCPGRKKNKAAIVPYHFKNPVGSMATAPACCMQPALGASSIDPSAYTVQLRRSVTSHRVPNARRRIRAGGTAMAASLASTLTICSCPRSTALDTPLADKLT